MQTVTASHLCPMTYGRWLMFEPCVQHEYLCAHAEFPGKVRETSGEGRKHGGGRCAECRGGRAGMRELSLGLDFGPLFSFV